MSFISSAGDLKGTKQVHESSFRAREYARWLSSLQSFCLYFYKVLFIFVMCVIMLCALLLIELHEVTKTSDAN